MKKVREKISCPYTFITSPDNGTSAVAEVEEPRAVNVENRVEARSVPVKVHHRILLLIKVLLLFMVGKDGLATPLYRPVHLYLAG